MNLPRLDNVHGCIREQEDCSQGLVFLDHLWSRVLDEIKDAEKDWKPIEAAAAKWARMGAPSGITATEIKGRIHEYVSLDPTRQEISDRLTEARVQKEKLLRFFDSIGKRQTAAQSAQKGHAQLSRGGGGA